MRPVAALALLVSYLLGRELTCVQAGVPAAHADLSEDQETLTTLARGNRSTWHGRSLLRRRGCVAPTGVRGIGPYGVALDLAGPWASNGPAMGQQWAPAKGPLTKARLTLLRAPLLRSGLPNLTSTHTLVSLSTP